MRRRLVTSIFLPSLEPQFPIFVGTLPLSEAPVGNEHLRIKDAPKEVWDTEARNFKRPQLLEEMSALFLCLAGLASKGRLI